MSARLNIWRARLFSGPLTSLVTIAIFALIVAIGWPLLRWAVLNADVSGATRADCTSGGACWVFVKQRFGQFMYGFYPVDQRWRIDLWAIVSIASVALLLWKNMPRRGWFALVVILIWPPLGVWLLGGGFGLQPIETRQWGGLTLTMFLAIYAGLIAIPLGILLALGRQSRLPVVRLISIIFIEFWRGVPIIAVIFLASLLLPLIMPSGVGVDRLARAVIGLAFVISAYMAEAVRGGLQAIPTGQHEAAKALGLNYWKATGFIILPQALRISLPAMTNEFIALFKNTTLVLVVSILDLLGVAQASLADPSWVGYSMEAYAFTGLIYWLICFALSRFAKSLETNPGQSRHRMQDAQ
ncbi:amino acid ABC transporter permease [Terrarubrum flagellatum]|uniref:amino acid ABC transporter permease n=1 Tax=Terrirubrum flagellatum TaxID=2895980 RepID=UPI0031455615